MLIQPGLSRAVLGGSLILAPLLLVAAGLLDPTISAEDERALLAIAAESSQTLELTQLFYVLAGLTLIPAGSGLLLMTIIHVVGLIGGMLLAAVGLHRALAVAA